MKYTENQTKLLITARPGRSIDPWDCYLHQYKLAVEQLIDSVIEKRYCIDILVHPIMYLIRHSLEIGMKLCISGLENTLNQETTKKKTHRLKALLDRYCELRQKFMKDCQQKEIDYSGYDDTQKLKCLKELVHGNNKFPGFTKIDENAVSFRYPSSYPRHREGDDSISIKNNEPFFTLNDTINVQEVYHLYLEAICLLMYDADVKNGFIGNYEDEY